MDISLNTHLLGNLVLPPVSLFILLLLALWLRKFLRGFAWFLVFVATFGLLGLSMPLTSQWLAAQVEKHPVLSGEQWKNRAQAIVILGGGSRYSREYSQDVSIGAVGRLRYGARLARASGLPVLVTGGVTATETPEAQLMASVLQQDFAVTARWLELESKNTAENARLSAPILQRADVSTIVLVTDAFHMQRSEEQFLQQGFTVIAAPMNFHSKEAFEWQWKLLFPTVNSLKWSYLSLHEMLGRVWYRMRYSQEEVAASKE